MAPMKTMKNIGQLPSRRAIYSGAAIIVVLAIALTTVAHAEERTDRQDRPERPQEAVEAIESKEAKESKESKEAPRPPAGLMHT